MIGGWRPRELCNKVDIISSTNFASEPLKNLVLPQMEEFVVGYELCKGSDIEALGRLMPGLKRLRIGLDNEGFKAACKNWTQLRHLDLDPFDVEEEGILGIKDGKKYSQPNITDLKYLASLRIGSPSGNDSTKGWLTQDSVVDGLLVSESLRSVWTRRAPKATVKVRQMFASRFPQ
ncbi:putative F-box/LRR-repeat protein 23 [Orchesella cincta]|uniref:Putative F-box/LRR-repeat protein 23 n=1 Tax=Orchesella cincta TaxID=48709 RepID=A0A1D2MBB5_ORCCI|nr:putative F-box/LRR-repeat protein 23 [Orchesella cincta]